MFFYSPRQAGLVLGKLITVILHRTVPLTHSVSHEILTRNSSFQIKMPSALGQCHLSCPFLTSLPYLRYLLGVHPKNSPGVKLTPLDVEHARC